MANKILVLIVATLAPLATSTNPSNIRSTKHDDQSAVKKSMMKGGGGRRGGRVGEGMFDMCCEELERMESSECQYEAMRMMIKGMMPSHHMSDDASQMATMIPMMCGTMKHKCPMSTM